MSKTLHINLELTVADDAQPFAVADFVFEHLMYADEVNDYAPIESIDGTMPSLG